MYFVYLLQSQQDPEKWYVGLTCNLERRMIEHNNGHSVHTNKFRPWELNTYVVFRDQIKAQAFELYLKTGTGRAFSKRHL